MPKVSHVMSSIGKKRTQQAGLTVRGRRQGFQPLVNLSTLVIRLRVSQGWGFPGDSDGKESACNAEDLSSILALGRSPEGGHGNPLQYFCLGNPLKQRSLVGYSPRGHKELDTTEQLSANTHSHTHTHTQIYITKVFFYKTRNSSLFDGPI